MKDTEFEELLSEICGVGNMIRKTNLIGRERIFAKIHESNQDLGTKDILSVFSRAYIDGSSKKAVRNKLVLQMNISEENADKFCNMSCLKW